jgi:thiamine kinase-like enzyme
MDLAFHACDKSKSYCRPLVKYPPVDVFRAEQGGMSTQTVYLFHQKKKRVVLLRYDEAMNNYSSLQAIEDGIASFKRFDCYAEVSSDMVSANANIISTRWVISIKMNDDDTWRSKARLVVATRTKRMTECNRIPLSLRLRLRALYWRYWLRNSGFQTLGTLQQPFCKVSTSLVTFLSCRRLTLSAATSFCV